MIEEARNSSDQRLGNKALRIILLSAIGMIISLIDNLIEGYPMYTVIYDILYWSFLSVVSLIVLQAISKRESNQNKEVISFLPYLIILLPFAGFVRLLLDVSWEFNNIFVTLVYIFTSIVSISSLLMVFNQYKHIGHEELNAMTLTENVEPSRVALAKVIKSIRGRANQFNKRMYLNLFYILLIVIIGGGASFGLAALKEASVFRDLESQRIQLIKVLNELEVFDDNDIRSKNGIKRIINETYPTSVKYETLIEKLEKNSEISWRDIAMRVTIAALTLFLVRIVFQMYKYNQQQSSNLLARAEILELYLDDKSDLDSLREGLLTKLEANPSFNKTDSNSAEQLLKLIAVSKGQ